MTGYHTQQLPYVAWYWKQQDKSINGVGMYVPQEWENQAVLAFATFSLGIDTRNWRVVRGGLYARISKNRKVSGVLCGVGDG